MLKHRIAVYKNDESRKPHVSHIRHMGTHQILIWAGPVFVILRNRRSAQAIINHENLNDGSM